MWEITSFMKAAVTTTTPFYNPVEREETRVDKYTATVTRQRKTSKIANLYSKFIHYFTFKM